MAEKKRTILSWIINNPDLSDKLKYQWHLQYSAEYNAKMRQLGDRIKEKLYISEKQNMVRFEIARGEILVLDLKCEEY